MRNRSWKLMAVGVMAFGMPSLLQISHAADTEAFEPQSVETGRPNVLFVVDSTATLAEPVSVPPYVAGTDYGALLANNQRCDATKAYFDTASPGGFPDCRSNKVGAMSIANDLVCDRAAPPNKGTLTAEGRLEDKFLVKKNADTYLQLANTYKAADGKVYCEGATGAPPAAEFASDVVVKTRLYSGNWLNYVKAIPLLPKVDGDPRMEVLKRAFRTIADKYAGDINIGMMRTSTTGAKQDGGAGKGGMVVFPIRSMDAPALYGAYHGGATALDDFIWTLFDRVACKQDADCGGPADYPMVEMCDPEDKNDCIPVMYPNGGSKALAEMMYEAYLYFAGSPVDYGSRSAVDPTIDFDSVPESLAIPGTPANRNNYKSPLVDVCANNYIVLLTDGLSSQDSSSNLAIEKLLKSLPTTVLTTAGYPADANKVGCTKNSWGANAKAPSECIDDLAFYLQNADFDANPDNRRPGVKTYAVGFALDGSPEEADARKLLNDVAAAGGTGEAVFASNEDTIIFALEDIISKVLTGNTAFSAPSVTINAFNRTQNLNDLYMAVFRPEYLRKWEGNVKKYRINPVTGEIEGTQSGVPAVSALTGFFEVGSQSLWATQPDGLLAPIGGAASRIPDPVNRTILVNEADGSLSDLDDYVSGLDSAAKESIFDLTVSGAAADTLTAEIVTWLYGTDTYDEFPARPDDDEDGLFDDGNGIKAEFKKLMGDPLHSRPAVVVYGRPGRVSDENGVDRPERDAIVYITTNEGMLHALDSETGVEKWSFLPQELLYRLDFLRNDTEETELKKRTDPRYYGLDGSIRVLRIDRNQDGKIDTADGDRVFLYFGMRRGGSSYYALDVSNPAAEPQLMWRFQLPDAADGAQSWSNPAVGPFVRVSFSGDVYGSFGGMDNGDAANRYVVIFGGGFDPTNDSMGYVPDIAGNKIYMLDALDGDVLWWAGPEGSGADLELARMKHSIVADVRVVDLSGDNFADRMYAADLGGQVWRFDILNGKAAGDLVEGGLMAAVGGEDTGIDRRFYYAPDVSEIRCGGRTFYNVAVGSGDRENPVTDKAVRNSFFSFRDYMTRTPVDSSDYRANCDDAQDTCIKPIYDDGRLVDVTTVANPTVGADKAGWKMDLVGVTYDADTGNAVTRLRGEKALAESRTFAGNVYFTSYAPEPKNENQCGIEVGVNRLYVVNACNAKPPFNNDGNVNSVTVADRSQSLAQGSIAPEVVFVFPSPPPGCVSRDCLPPPQCLVGLQSCGRGLPNNPVRVFWRERGAE